MNEIDRRIRNQRLLDNSHIAMKSWGSPVTGETFQHVGSGQRQIREIQAAHDIHVRRKLQRGY